MGTDVGGTSLQNQYKDWLLGYNSNNGLDSTPRAVQDGIGNETPLQLSTAKVRIKPTSADGDVFDIVDLSGTVLFTINTSTKTITAASGVKFSGDGSLLTGIISTGTGGASEAANLELQADNDKDGVGDILLKLGATVIATIRNNGTVDGTTGEPVGGSFILLSLDEDKLATLTGDEIAYGNVDGVASVQDADGVHGIVLVDKWSEPKGGYEFDGTNHVEIEKNASINLGAGEFSIEWYGKYGDFVSGASTWNAILGDDGFGAGIGLYYINDQKLKAYINNVELSTNINYADEDIHILLTRVKSVATLYINKKQIVQVTDSAIANTVTNAYSLYIGRDNNSGRYSKGTHYLLRIWNMDVSDYIDNLYNNGDPTNANIPFEIRYGNKTNLISNGDFSSGATTGWSPTRATIDASTNELEVTATDDYGYASQDIITVKGKKYSLNFNYHNTSGDVAQYQIYDAANSQDIISRTDLFDATTKTNSGNIYFTATSATTRIILIAKLNTDVVYFDDVVVNPAGEDLELKDKNMGSNAAIGSIGGASVIANTSGSPIARAGLKDGRSGISTTEVQLENTQKAVTNLKGIIAIEKGGVSNSIALGTATGSYDLLDATVGALTANEEKYFEINSYSGSERDLFAVAGASSVDIILIYEEIA